MGDFAGSFGDKRRSVVLARLEQAMVAQSSVVVRRLGYAPTVATVAVPGPPLTFVLRTPLEPLSLVPAIRAKLRQRRRPRPVH